MVVGILWLFASNCNYHATTLMDIVYICESIFPLRRWIFASLRLFFVLQLTGWLVEKGK